jgi:RNA recognition motif-containing protein
MEMLPTKKQKTDATSTEGTRVFIGNLSYDIDEAATQEFFKDAGTITTYDWMTDKDTGKFYGTGFIEFETAEQANKSLAFNGKDLLGRAMKIELARPKTGGGGGGEVEVEVNPYLKNQETVTHYLLEVFLTM